MVRSLRTSANGGGVGIIVKLMCRAIGWLDVQNRKKVLLGGYPFWWVIIPTNDDSPLC